MSGYDFKHGTKFLMNDHRYVIRRDEMWDVEVENLNRGKIETWSKKQLLKAWESGNLQFDFIEKGSTNQPSVFMDFELLPEEIRKQVWVRYEIIKPVLNGEIVPSELLQYLQSIPKKYGISVSRTQFYEWKKKFEQYRDIRYLIPRYDLRGPQKPQTNVDVIEIIKDILEEYCYNGEKNTDQILYAEFLLRLKEINAFRDKNDQLKPISSTTFYRRRKELIDTDRFNKVRYGKTQADLMKHGVRKEVHVSRPLERVEIDSTPIDVLLVCPKTLKAKRPHLLYAIDKFSGYPLGFYVSFDEPDSRALKQCLLHCLLPKTYIKDLYPEVHNEWVAFGKPQTIVVDNAKINESKDFEDACAQIGIEDIQFCSIASGNQKGTIEKAFRDLNERLIHRLKGTTFSNPLQRANYDSENKACISLQGFIYMVHIAFVDLIANNWTARQGGGTPHQIWEEGLFENPFIRQTLSRNVTELKVLFMSGIENRTITNKGITIKNGNFNSPDLMLLKSQLHTMGREKEKVFVRYDLSDMRTIYVFNEINKTYIEAYFQSFERMSIDNNYPVPFDELEQYCTKYNIKKSEFDLIPIAEANRVIKNLEKQEQKTVNELRSNPDEHQEIISDSNDYWGISSEGISQIMLGNPEAMDTLVTLGETQNKRRAKRKKEQSGKPKQLMKKIVKDDPKSYEMNDLPVWGVTIKDWDDNE